MMKMDLDKARSRCFIQSLDRRACRVIVIVWCPVSDCTACCKTVASLITTIQGSREWEVGAVVIVASIVSHEPGCSASSAKLTCLVTFRRVLVVRLEGAEPGPVCQGGAETPQAEELLDVGKCVLVVLKSLGLNLFTGNIQ